MEGLLQEALDIGKVIGTKVNPILEYVAEKVSGFIDVSSVNVHLILIGAISMYLANMINGRDGLGIKFWAITVGLFMAFKYLGF